MKIDKEQVNKLKQLDRIEYKQEMLKIFGFFNTGSIIVLILYIFGAMMLFTFAMSLESEGSWIIILILACFVLLFSLCLFLAKIIDNRVDKMVEELDDKYFKVEVKK